MINVNMPVFFLFVCFFLTIAASINKLQLWLTDPRFTLPSRVVFKWLEQLCKMDLETSFSARDKLKRHCPITVVADLVSAKELSME